jgi:6-phosphogluconolactonase (cycloisomerase 2 family)
VQKKNAVGALANLKLMHKSWKPVASPAVTKSFWRDNFCWRCCLLRDQILIYDRTQNWQQVGTLDFPQGTGPRHGIFTRTVKLYL